MKVMSGLDARFLYSATPTVHMHTIKAIVVDASANGTEFTEDEMAELIGERLHRMPALRRRVVPALYGLGNPVVIDDAEFDIRNHLVFRRLDPPGDQSQLDAVIAETTGRPLDTSRPLWELTIVEGLEGDQMAFVVKLHHALADGIASVSMLENAFITELGDAVVEDYRPEAPPSRRQMLGSSISGATKAVRAAPRVAKQTVTGTRRARAARREETAEMAKPFGGPRTVFNVALTADRTYSTLSLPINEVVKAKNASKVSLNDIFLSLCGGAVRRYLSRFGDIPTRSLITSMPMATRTDRHRLGGNHVDNIFMPLHTDVVNPTERARAISASSAAARRVRNSFGTDLFELRSGMIPASLHGVAPRLWGMTSLADHFRPPLNLVTSFVRGPRKPMEVNGAVVTRLFSVGPILEGIGLNITAWSYVDSVYVSFLGCSASLPDPTLIAADMRAELDHWLTTL